MNLTLLYLRFRGWWLTVLTRIDRWYRVRPGYQADLEIAMSRGLALDALSRIKTTEQVRCSPRKAGIISMSTGKMIAPGNSPYYSVIKHEMTNGDIWIRCTRCGKCWKPPLRRDYKSELEFYLAIKEYNDALDFTTNNVPSSSVQFQFRKNGSVAQGNEVVRRLWSNTN